MIDVTEEVLSAMVQAIVREVDPERICLFGSRARGDARADSDMDLLIVESGPYSPDHSRWQAIKRVRRALSPFRIPKDILSTAPHKKVSNFKRLPQQRQP
jgi:predicted nucleotidyltransferase